MRVVENRDTDRVCRFFTASLVAFNTGSCVVYELDVSVIRVDVDEAPVCIVVIVEPSDFTVDPRVVACSVEASWLEYHVESYMASSERVWCIWVVVWCDCASVFTWCVSEPCDVFSDGFSVLVH